MRSKPHPLFWQCTSRVVCRFSDAGMTMRCERGVACVRKAPRHEIAGAPRVRLWGFGHADLGAGVWSKRLPQPHCVAPWAQVAERSWTVQVVRQDWQCLFGRILACEASGDAAG